MPQAVLIAALPSLIAGGAGAASTIMSSRAQSSAQKRATAASDAAARRAEAFEREQAAREDADQARLEAEDRRRWDIDQQNIAAERAERDARQQYIDKIQHQKRINLAQLTGGPTPEPMPNFGGTYAPQTPLAPMPSAPIMSRPSTANAMIAPPAAPFDPFTDAPQLRGVPLSALNRRRGI